MPDDLRADAVRIAGLDDLDAVVAALTDAFTTDPLMTWVFPDRVVRPARLDGVWGFMAGEGYLPLGASTVVEGDAAALWLPPGQQLGDDFWEPASGRSWRRSTAMSNGSARCRRRWTRTIRTSETTGTCWRSV